MRGIDLHLQWPQIKKRWPVLWQRSLGIETVVALRTGFILAMNEADEPWLSLGNVTPQPAAIDAPVWQFDFNVARDTEDE